MEGWKEKKIEEVANFSKGKLTEQCEGVNSKWLPLLNAEAIITESKYYANPKGAVVCAENDILMLWDGERSGLVTIGKSGVVGSTFSKISLSNELDSQFCFYFLQNQYSWIQNRRTGTGVPHVAKDLPKILDISYPSSLIEQQEIARILITLDNTIKKTEQLITKYKNIKQGLMHDLLTYGIDENGTIRNPQTHTFVEKKGLLVPEEWVAVEINDVATIGNGCDYKHLKEGTIPVLGTGGYMTSVNDYIYDGETVCIGRKGTIDFPQYHTGKIWTVDTLFYTHSFKDILPKLLFFIFQTINWKKYNEATGVPSLSKKTISKIKISIPTKIDEQQKIISIIEQQDKIIESEQTNLTKLQKLKQGLMADLLTGKVRVKTESV